MPSGKYQKTCKSPGPHGEVYWPGGRTGQNDWDGDDGVPEESAVHHNFDADVFAVEHGVESNDYSYYRMMEDEETKINSSRHTGILGAALNLWREGKFMHIVPYKAVAVLLFFYIIACVLMASSLILFGSQSLNHPEFECVNSTLLDSSPIKMHDIHNCREAKYAQDQCDQVARWSLEYGILGMSLMVLTYVNIRAQRRLRDHETLKQCCEYSIMFIRFFVRLVTLGYFIYGNVLIIDKYANHSSCASTLLVDPRDWDTADLAMVFWTIAVSWILIIVSLVFITVLMKKAPHELKILAGNDTGVHEEKPILVSWIALTSNIITVFP